MAYNSKNYTEQNGAKTVIGGELEIASGGALSIVEGGQLFLEGGPLAIGTGGPMPNQAVSTADTIAKCKSDLNALILKLEESGLMVRDIATLPTAGGATTSSSNTTITANNGKVSAVSITGDDATVTADIATMTAVDPEGGTNVKKWIALYITTGLSTSAGIEIDGEALTTAEAATNVTNYGITDGALVFLVDAEAGLDAVTIRYPGCKPYTLSFTVNQSV